MVLPPEYQNASITMGACYKSVERRAMRVDMIGSQRVFRISVPPILC